MGESEYIDLFPGNEGNMGQQGMGQAPFGFEDQIYNPGRSRINDYKHTSSTIQKGQISFSGENAAHPRPAEKKKTFLNLTDERLVWAGAIFVFFGVLVFLVGYWLGKTTMKDMGLSNQTSVRNVQEKLDQRKIENSFGAAPASPDKPATALPDGTALVPSSSAKDEILTAPPISASPAAAPSVAAPSRSVKLTTTSVKKTDKTPVKSDSRTAPAMTAGDGHYTLQISAHTSMDKARSIEDQLRRQGHQSYIVEAAVNGVTYYRVRVGKFGSKQDAQNALSRIKSTSMGRDSYLLNLN